MNWHKLGVAFVAISTSFAPLSTPAKAKAPTTYFLVEMNVLDAVVSLPSNAQGIIAAKVHLREPIVYSGGPDLFLARLRVTEVLRGEAEVGQVLDVYLGERGDHRGVTFPCTPDQRSREYTITSYISEAGLRRLAAFPITEDQHKQWDSEVNASRCLHGIRDEGE
jgi:hypothetical protein